MRRDSVDSVDSVELALSSVGCALPQKEEPFARRCAFAVLMLRLYCAYALSSPGAPGALVLNPNLHSFCVWRARIHLKIYVHHMHERAVCTAGTT